MTILISNSSDKTLRVTEIFKSLQGESSYAGQVTTFIRLTGCPLRCQYCDTAYAFQGGKKYSFDEIISQVKKFSSPYVCVTGGEPLAQKGAFDLINQLAQLGYKVSVETSGAMKIKGLSSLVKRVVDIKTPGSCEESKNLLENLEELTSLDEVKFVICSKGDFEWSLNFAHTHLSHVQSSQILFSPSYHQVKPEDLASWLVDSNSSYRLQIQLHKALWGEKQGV
jgi:7-carboxy-7-deazaguanine synthase